MRCPCHRMRMSSTDNDSIDCAGDCRSLIDERRVDPIEKPPEYPASRASQKNQDQPRNNEASHRVDPGHSETGPDTSSHHRREVRASAGRGGRQR